MIDDTYSLALPPSSMRFMGVEGANAIEANLQYLILLFPYFRAALKTDAIGSYGFLELTEVGRAGDGFSIEAAVRIDKIIITVSGTDLGALTWHGAGWAEESSAEGALILAYTSETFLTVEQIQAALDGLSFAASEDLDASLTLQVSNTAEGDFIPVGPVAMLFRGGTTWLLVEGKDLAWEDVESAEMTWDDFETMKK